MRNSVLTRREAVRLMFGLASGGLLVACSQQATPAKPTEAPKPAEAAKPGAAAPAQSAPSTKASGRLSVYSSLSESTNNDFFGAFRQDHPGVETDILGVAAAGEMVTRIRAEKAAPKADIFIGGGSEVHHLLGQEGLLEPYVSPNSSDLDPAFRDPNGNWTGWYLGVYGLCVNTDRWAKEMADRPKPKTWDDILWEDAKGKFVIADLSKSAGALGMFVTQILRFDNDEDKALDYMKRLNANVGQYAGTATQVIELVAQGQFLLGTGFLHDVLFAANKGQPIEPIAPVPTYNEVGGVSIVKGGPNTPTAKAFVDWALTKEAGELNVKLSNRLSVRKDVPPAPGAPTLETVTLVKYDPIWVAENRERLLKKWQAAVGL